MINNQIHIFFKSASSGATSEANILKQNLLIASTSPIEGTFRTFGLDNTAAPLPNKGTVRTIGLTGDAAP